MTKPRHNIAAQVASLGADSLLPDYCDPPFSVTPDIVLILPAPPPTNKLRRIDWRNHAKHKAWREQAGKHLMLARSGGKKLGAISGRFELILTMDGRLKRDLDSTIKSVADFVVLHGLVKDDGYKYMRKITLQWGDVEGIKVVLRGIE